MNLITPEQAKEKWCPFSRVASKVGPFNRLGTPGELADTSKCIAGECMAWKVPRYIQDAPPEAQPSVNVDYLGHCGLAG